ncbi:MAG: site-specific DNA-methyltransferase [Chloroflexota bacterium]|nr:site-specific DNA-methyltransferase [Chloroflexota bacterium]
MAELHEPDIRDTFSEECRIVVHEGDAYAFVRGLPDESVALVVTSPPYGMARDYETHMSMECYLETLDRVIDELVRILRPDGSICWQVGNVVRDSEVIPLDIVFYGLFKAKGLRLRNRIVWHFGHGLHASKRFSGRYETILWFTRGDHYTFDLDAVRVAAKYPGKRHFKGPNRGKPSGNPLGKNPCDVWEVVAEEWQTGIWNIPNVKANHPEKSFHPCQFPVELAERCILALSREDEWVLDPYCGVGSALIAGLKHGRRVMGCDKQHAYIAAARQRVSDFYAGTLKLRPLGKPVYAPKGTEAVARIPDEWRTRGDDVKET